MPDAMLDASYLFANGHRSGKAVTPNWPMLISLPLGAHITPLRGVGLRYVGQTCRCRSFRCPTLLTDLFFLWSYQVQSTSGSFQPVIITSLLNQADHHATDIGCGNGRYNVSRRTKLLMLAPFVQCAHAEPVR